MKKLLLILTLLFACLSPAMATMGESSTDCAASDGDREVTSTEASGDSGSESAGGVATN